MTKDTDDNKVGDDVGASLKKAYIAVVGHDLGHSSPSASEWSSLLPVCAGRYETQNKIWEIQNWKAAARLPKGRVN